VDRQRILVLRTVSNYDRPPRGMSAAESLDRQRAGATGAFLQSIENAYTVGHVVVNELLTGWPNYAKATPGANPSAQPKL
jgi:purine nucleoside permease